MKEILLVVAGSYIGWWLALNKEQQTRQALVLAQSELNKAKNEIVNQIKENEALQDILGDEEFRKENEA